MVTRIDTKEQFEAIRKSLVPEYVISKKHGKIQVPCCNTILVKTSLVVANLYNPNSVSDDKMELLKRSILDNGFCFPIVAIWDEDQQLFVVIDGFHRTVIGGPNWLDFDYVPVALLNHDITKRMAATVQFNKARGVHQVDLDAEVIRALIEQGLSETEIAERLGIELEAVHRYKQITGVAELFKNVEYSMSWEMSEE
jgi:ParB-like chromosome segregation protein Spo0J